MLSGIGKASRLISSLKSIYQMVVPEFIRSSPLGNQLRGLQSHDMLYDKAYYAGTIESSAMRSAATIATSIIHEFSPKQAIDVGCGTGALLEALRDQGCEVFGLEYSDAALEYCQVRKLNVQKFKIGKDIPPSSLYFDVAISMEVAEHLPEKLADAYLDLLVNLSDVIVFTAAPPGQGGTDHVNEQPATYWIQKYQHRSFQLDEALSMSWREHWQTSGQVESWYFQNLMIFKKS